MKNMCINAITSLFDARKHHDMSCCHDRVVNKYDDEHDRVTINNERFRVCSQYSKSFNVIVKTNIDFVNEFIDDFNVANHEINTIEYHLFTMQSFCDDELIIDEM